ncbi:hypothetical protein BVRB_8g200540 [Beta vulgaris subsp. vulgaris]|uniref:Uncharacterized protein n=2 Tax=Beta vulgaris subsp. vulgaris TaxID=3555 RepID=A0A7G2RM90_BETVV|nr:hypothetical protein BVRB_8g200540 [Beta vulgaris subsp. vulgaris]
MMEKEDPEDKHHRKAQFLIYKTLKQVDQVIVKKSSRPSWLRLRICKLKIRIGKKLLKLRKTILVNMVKTKMGVCKHVMGHLKNFKRLFRVGGRHGGAAIGHLPQPLFT